MGESLTAASLDEFRSPNLTEARLLAREYAQRVREHFGGRVHNVWIYGSAARGDWTRDSDIDVLVLLHQESEGDMEWLVRTAYRMGLMERRLLLQPVMLTSDEFDRLASEERRFALDILEQGIAA